MIAIHALFRVPEMGPCSTKAIRLLLGDCSTATNKVAYVSRNNDHVSHMPSSQVAYIALHSHNALYIVL